MPFAAVGMEPDKVQLWSLLFSLSMIASLCVAFLVAQLGSTRGGLRGFHVLFPPRRPRVVPWGISTIAPVLVIFLLIPSIPHWIITQIFPEPLDFLQHGNVTIDNLADQHPLTILMQKSGHHSLVILVCFLTAVIVAPLTEELVFRIVFQGGIQATLRREFGQTVMAKWFPVVVTAVFFAGIHFRLPTQPEIDQHYIDQLFKGMISILIGRLIAVAAVIVFFRSYYRIRPSDIGLRDFRHIGRDALGALLLTPAVFIPVVIVNAAVQKLAKTQWAATHDISGSMIDPVPLFLFSLVIGTLYYRTQRFASVFFLHAFFNLFSFLILMYLTFR